MGSTTPWWRESEQGEMLTRIRAVPLDLGCLLALLGGLTNACADRTSASAAQRYDIRARFQLVQIVRPLLHHLAALR